MGPGGEGWGTTFPFSLSPFLFPPFSFPLSPSFPRPQQRGVAHEVLGRDEKQLRRARGIAQQRRSVVEQRRSVCIRR